MHLEDSALRQFARNSDVFSVMNRAALDEDDWRTAMDKPHEFLEERGFAIDERLEFHLTESERRVPWPRPELGFERVTVRCWWASERDDDGKPTGPPFRFCLQIPQGLLRPR